MARQRKDKERTITTSIRKDAGAIVTTGLFTSVIKDYHTSPPANDPRSIVRRSSWRL